MAFKDVREFIDALHRTGDPIKSFFATIYPQEVRDRVVERRESYGFT